MLGLILFAAATLNVCDDARSLAAAAIDAANEWKLDAADDTARRAYLLAVECEDLAAQSLARDASAVVARLRGDRPRAVAESAIALELAERAGDLTAQARAHNNLGRIDAELLGKLEGANRHYRLALDLATRAENLPLRARVLNNIGNLERMRSRRAAALDAFSAALRIASRAKDAYGQLAAEHNIGLIFAEQNDPGRALPHLQRALAIEQRLGSAAAARTLLSIAEAHRALGDHAEAARHLKQASEVASEKGDAAVLASALLRQADLAIDGKRFTDAADAIARSRSISEGLNDRATLPLVDAYDAKLALSRGRAAAAGTRAARAIAGATALRQLDVVAQAESIRGAAALQEGNRTAARAAFEAAVRAVEHQRLGVAGDALARQRFFGVELFPYEQMIGLLADAGDAKGALRYAEMKRARIVSEASQGRTRPPGGVVAGAVVSYAMAGTKVVAIVEAEGPLRIVTLPASREEIARKANAFAAQLAQRDHGFVAAARELYDILWQPLGLSGFDRVRILPDEELWRVPFAALRDPAGRFLIESVTLSYAPAVSAIADDPPRQPRSVLLADNLPAHPTEIRAIAAIYGGVDVEVIENADEATVKRSLSRYDIVHIAAHGVFEDRDPLESHLQLRPSRGEDGRLTARELMSESLSASLLVLSSCDSASGTVAAGEGLMSMTWAALVAGCPTIVASQWQVASNGTTELMTAFHHQLRTGKRVAESLRAAQIAAARKQASAHPYYWAAFVVVGR